MLGLSHQASTSPFYKFGFGKQMKYKAETKKLNTVDTYCRQNAIKVQMRTISKVY
jgi:hypothetical protein